MSEKQTDTTNKMDATIDDGDSADLTSQRNYLVGTITDDEYQKQQSGLFEDKDVPHLSDLVQLPVDEEGNQRFEVKGQLGRGSGGSGYTVYDKLI
ncbi:MAG: hypothetical protein HRT77_16220, partial [Halioglobus sp.]|nr:hypothetical protein [Halioglobus sp.]